MKRWGAMALAIVLVMIFCLDASAEDIPNKKKIAEYGGWSVNLNYMDISNPLCQVDGMVLSPELLHGGLVTFWRDYSRPGLVDFVQIEVAIMSSETQMGVPLLDKDGAHQFGNEAGIVRGNRRPSPSVNMALFVMKKDDFKKVISPPNNLVMTILYDREGNEITVGAPLDGLADALDQCKVFK